MVCHKHPTYKGIEKPKPSCETCWAYWFGLSERCVNCGCEEKAREVMEKL